MSILLSDISGSLFSSKPTFFELFAADKFFPSLRPALGALARRLPFAAARHADHAVAVLWSIVDIYFLHRHCSSFGEHLYGLKREFLAPSPRLRRLSRYGSFLFLVWFPHCKELLDRRYREDRLLSLLPPSARWHAVGAAYPWISACIEGAIFVYHLMYLAGRSRYFSPALQLLQAEMKRMDVEDLTGSSQAVRLLLVAAFLAFKFTQWWRAGGSRSPADRVTPGPPPDLPSAAALPKDVCPLCSRSPLERPAVLATSGVCFCFSCIRQHVEQTGSCPVSGIPSRMEDIRRLYET